MRICDRSNLIAQRMMMRRMPSSIREKAQITWEPKAMGVKTNSSMRRISIVILDFGFWISDFNLEP